MTNLPATLSTLNQQIAALNEKLVPVTGDHVARGIRSLLAAGLSLPSGMQADKAPEIYGYALAGVPAYGLQVAISKIIRGEYDINRAFVPSAPELAAIARAEARVIREDKVRLTERASAMTIPKAEPVSEAGKQKIKSLLRGFRAKHSAAKSVSSVPQEPMSDAKAEYYQKIMELRDAPEMNREHAMFRNHISQEIETRKDTL